MDFMEILKAKGLQWMVEDHPLPNLNFKGKDLLFYKGLEDIIQYNKKTLFVGDPDVDGVISTIEVKKAFDKLNYRNYDINEFVDRTHGITDTIARKVITGYDAVIIVDGGTNQVDLLNKMARYGKTVIVLDHHMPEHTEDEYHTNVLIVNTKMIDMSWTMSAGALIAFLFYNLFRLNGREKEGIEFLKLGAITIYSDSCRMDKINLALVQFAGRHGAMKPPEEIVPFMNDYSHYCRNFFDYTFDNRINACLKENNFEVINKLIRGEYLVDEIEKTYRESKAYADGLLNRIKLETFSAGKSYENIIVARLPDEPKAVNYTGSVGSNITGLTNKLAVTYHPSLKGSVRDSQQRNILDIWRTSFDSGGHISAFGFHLKYDQVDDFRVFINHLDRLLLTRENQDIIIDNVNPTDVGLMADFNEVSNINALIKLTVVPSMSIRRWEKSISIKWGNFYITSFKPVGIGDILYVKPIIDKSGFKLMVNSMEV